MGQFPFDPQTPIATSSGTFNGPRFFSLKKDGDSAIVRFMYTQPTEFEVFNTHKVVTPKFKFGRTVSCLLNPMDDISKCPFCSSTNRDISKVQKKFYVRMLEYIKNADGTVSVEPRIWERPIGYAYELAGKFNIYGALNQSIFIITRHTPDPNNTQGTTYATEYAPPTAFPESLYPNKPELFDNYKISGVALFAPTYEEAQYYCANGDFPVKQPAAQSSTTSSGIAQTYTPQTPPQQFVPTQQAYTPVQSTTNNLPPFTPPQQVESAPWDMNPDAPVQRPVRQY